MKLRILPIDRIVSMDEIDDCFEARGRWNGKRFELASTHAKKLSLCRSHATTWLTRADWLIQAVMATPPVSIALVPGISVGPHSLQTHHPDRVRHIVAEDGRSEDKITAPTLALLFAPLICWTTALLMRRRSRHIRIEHENALGIDRVSFVEPLAGDGLLGSPEALLYLNARERGRDSFYVLVLTLSEDLPCGSDPNQRPLSRVAAPCLLIEAPDKRRSTWA